MNTTKKIQSALICLFKRRLEPIVRQLNSQNVTLYSTGGTEDL
jgi:phosphoribosylaminoimidazolecarboxamide formyltransferase/IMP cyclohydrolase